jgi:hypothetical protein
MIQAILCAAFPGTWHTPLAHGRRLRHSQLFRVLFLALALCLGSTSVVHAATVTATWNANSEIDIAGYILSYGTQPGVHPTVVDVGNVITWPIATLTPGQVYYFVVQAYNTSAATSVASAEIVFLDPMPGPSLTSLNPTSGAVGMTVTIAGANFGATQGTSTVKFNGIAAVPTSWNATGITVPVPSTATTGSVVVTVGGVASNGITFTVTVAGTTTIDLAPQDTYLNVDSINYGTAVTLGVYTWPANQIGNASMMKFGLSQIPAGATILSATLNVNLVAVDAFPAEPTYTVTLNKIINHNPDLTKATGNTYDGVNAWTASTCCFSNIPMAQADISTARSTTAVDRTLGFKTWDATATVQEWLATPATNFGLLLNADVSKGADHYRTFASMRNVATTARPYLHITYLTAPAPSLTSLNPTSGAVGMAVTIAGANLGATQGTSTVKFNGTAAAPTNWNGTSITVPVPSAATTGTVVVTVGGVASNGITFTVTVPAPSLTSLNPTSGPAGMAVTIAGTNFGATTGTSTVTFNGTTATPTAWAATSIVVPVPAGATTGPVLVKVGGVASNGVAFTVTTTTTTARAEMTTPAPRSTLTASTVTFQWTGGKGVSQDWLNVGTTAGGTDLFDQSLGTSLNATVGGLPTNGRTIYVRLWSMISGGWQYNDDTYTATTTTTKARAELTTPAPGSTLSASTVTIQWTGGTGVSQYWLNVGTTAGVFDLFSQSLGTSLSATVAGLPTNGGTVYLRLWSLINGAWQYNDGTYKATTTTTTAMAQVMTPAPGSTLSASTVAIQWTGGTGVSQYWLNVGTTAGVFDLFSQSLGTSLNATVAGLPTNGSTVYLRLWSMINGAWQYTDDTYSAATGGSTRRAEVTTPAPRSTLTASTVTFQWTGGTGVSQDWLNVGTTAGGTDLFDQSLGTSLNATVGGLPTNGRTIYVRLWSLIDGAWQYSDDTYTSTGGSAARAEVTTPAPGSTLTASTVTFQWTGGTGVSQYWLAVGTTAGAGDLLYQDRGTGLNATVAGLPTNGATLYVRLWSMINGVWLFTDYTYTDSTR